MSDGLDPEIAALLSQSGGGEPASDAPVMLKSIIFSKYIRLQNQFIYQYNYVFRKPSQEGCLHIRS